MASEANWHYIGHYGQLGPLTQDQMAELVASGVIAKDTYVWRTGISDWIAAERATELRPAFDQLGAFANPPPPPTVRPVTPTAPLSSSPPLFGASPSLGMDYPAVPSPIFTPAMSYVRSDKSRIAAGILQLVLPGIGRMYLGYAAIGILQLALTLCAGIGYIWSLIDGILMLTGSVKVDGYGRQLPD